ncbi:MAG: histidine--tRNA ligase [Candidatus Korarchaeota archaeon NZ13-K]|nr:MAG: histidine--tRNA ligase [Candidatus Korarchaeota archaeon NZ13-K]
MLSIPRGFRDFPPPIMILRKKVLGRIEEVFKRYGFDPFETPALEYWETVKGKLGEEAESKLMFVFPDFFSKEWYTLRYELTFPLARYIAMHPDTPLPFKRYHIGRVWRHEEPQRGRYREFWQCDADVVGSPYPEADAEVISVNIDVMRAFSFENFVVRVNDRRLLTGIFEEELGISNPTPIYRAIDKLDKIGEEGVRRELIRLGLHEPVAERIMRLISFKGEFSEVSSSYREFRNDKIEAALSHLEEVFSIVSDDRLILDLSLVRGLEYYTGPVFETSVSEPRIGSLAGGGRYDKLIALYSGRDVPATGVSIGVERLIDAGLELGIFDLNERSYNEVFVVSVRRESWRYAWQVASLLRRGGVNTSLDLMRRSQGSQREYANKMGAKIIAFVGPSEEETGTVTLYSKNVRRTVKISEVVSHVKEILSSL